MNTKDVMFSKISIVIVLSFLITTCSSSRSDKVENDRSPTKYSQSTLTPTQIASNEATITPAPTITPTIRPSITPQVILSPKHFGFPVSFVGEFSLPGNLRYIPCFHWDGKTNKTVDDIEVWKWLFHAGDMFVLNTTSDAKPITVVSPINGIIDRISFISKDHIEIIIRTPYFYEGSQVYVDLNHAQALFPGNEVFPEIAEGVSVEKGQPIAIQDTLLLHGRIEQVLDIAIRNGPRGANPSIPGNYYPESYLDPFLFLEDDIKLHNEMLEYDTIWHRDHCSNSIHYPYTYLDP